MSRPANIHIKEAKQALIHRIETMTQRIPPTFNNWHHSQSVNFKNTVDAAARYIKRTRVTMPVLAKLNAALSEFWK